MNLATGNPYGYKKKITVTYNPKTHTVTRTVSQGNESLIVDPNRTYSTSSGGSIKGSEVIKQGQEAAAQTNKETTQTKTQTVSTQATAETTAEPTNTLPDQVTPVTGSTIDRYYITGMPAEQGRIGDPYYKVTDNNRLDALAKAKRTKEFLESERGAEVVTALTFFPERDLKTGIKKVKEANQQYAASKEAYRQQAETYLFAKQQEAKAYPYGTPENFTRGYIITPQPQTSTKKQSKISAGISKVSSFMDTANKKVSQSKPYKFFAEPIKRHVYVTTYAEQSLTKNIPGLKQGDEFVGAFKRSATSYVLDKPVTVAATFAGGYVAGAALGGIAATGTTAAKVIGYGGKAATTIYAGMVGYKTYKEPTATAKGEFLGQETIKAAAFMGGAKLGSGTVSAIKTRYTLKNLKAVGTQEGQTEILRGSKIREGIMVEESGSLGKVSVYQQKSIPSKQLTKIINPKYYTVGTTSQKFIEIGSSTYQYKTVALVRGNGALKTYVGAGQGKIGMTETMFIEQQSPSMITRGYSVGGKEQGVLYQLSNLNVNTGKIKLIPTTTYSQKYFGGQMIEVQYPIKTSNLQAFTGQAKTDYIITSRSPSTTTSRGSVGEYRALTSYEISGNVKARLEVGSGQIKGANYYMKIPQQKLIEYKIINYNLKKGQFEWSTFANIGKRASLGGTTTQLFKQPEIQMPAGSTLRPAPTSFQEGITAAKSAYAESIAQKSFIVPPLTTSQAGKASIISVQSIPGISKQLKPMIETSAASAIKPGYKSITEPVTKPKSLPSMKPSLKPSSKPASKTISKPIAKIIQKPIQKVIQKPTQKTIQKLANITTTPEPFTFDEGITPTPSRFDLNFPRQSRITKSFIKPLRLLRQPKEYTPSGTSILTGIKGTPSKAGTITGLGIRPIPKTKKRRRKTLWLN